MNFIITETQYNRYVKGNQNLMLVIVKYLNKYISKGKRKIGQKSRNYGNLREEWCVDGKETLSAYYYFEGDNPDNGSLVISEELIKTIMSLFSVRSSYVVHIIEEWYSEVMVPKFEEIVGESGLILDSVDISTYDNDCIPESVKPEGITDEEMISFIDKNTLYKRQEIINMVSSGERDLEDFYLDIVEIVKRKEIRGI
jgi:hypothetical protein